MPLMEIDAELYNEIFNKLWRRLKRIQKKLAKEGINPIPSMNEMINAVLEITTRFDEDDLEDIIRKAMKVEP
ncbi:MAG: hypothetical protein H3Z53_01105 [archaeon]|nr:hypothetical protein [archaeon]MCP8312961.1 hypothetical protein [archaeon]